MGISEEVNEGYQEVVKEIFRLPRDLVRSTVARLRPTWHNPKITHPLDMSWRGLFSCGRARRVAVVSHGLSTPLFDAPVLSTAMVRQHLIRGTFG